MEPCDRSEPSFQHSETGLREYDSGFPGFQLIRAPEYEGLCAFEDLSVAGREDSFAVVQDERPATTLGSEDYSPSVAPTILPLMPTQSCTWLPRPPGGMGHCALRPGVWLSARPPSKPASRIGPVFSALTAGLPRPSRPPRSAPYIPRGAPKPKPSPAARGAYSSYPSCGNSSSGAAQPGRIASGLGMHSLALLSDSTHLESESVHMPFASADLARRTANPRTSATLHSKQWQRALVMWHDLCISIACASTMVSEILRQADPRPMLELLLRKVSDSTALRYMGTCIKVLATVSDLGYDLSGPSQVQLLDSIQVTQRALSSKGPLHQDNVLKALRWLRVTAALESWPCLHSGLFHSNVWRRDNPRKESVPLPLSFLVWLEGRVILHDLSDRPRGRSSCNAFRLHWSRTSPGRRMKQRMMPGHIPLERVRLPLGKRTLHCIALPLHSTRS